MSKKKPKRDVKKDIVAHIIEALKEVDPKDCVMPWRKLSSPINGQTGKPYSGINVLTLTLRASTLGVSEGAWLTFKQAKKLGGTVLKGETGVPGIFYRTFTKEKEDGEEDTFRVPRHFTLFHTSQCEGLDEEKLKTSTLPPKQDDAVTLPDEITARLDALRERSPAKTLTGGDRAAYSPPKDVIFMPDEALFYSGAGYWLTYLHELVHASGHKSRLNREQSARFGSRGYAFEELVAELGAARLGQVFGITPCEACGEDIAREHITQHAAYIASWIRMLEDEPHALFDAWTLATDACDWVEEMERDAASSPPLAA